MKFQNFLLLFLLSLAACKSRTHHSGVVAIQPIGKISPDKIVTVRQALDSIYHIRVVVLKTIEPPKDAFINIKTPRYRADKLVDWLKEIKPDTVDYIMGLTGYDISTTKRDWLGRIKEPRSRYEDFGIFGLGSMPGESCVLSYFRLGNDLKVAANRLAKICVHELGHNFGLDHCPDKTCVMEDAVEKISTVDGEEMGLCEKCQKEIKTRFIF